jgi:hypothetical protein
MSHSRMQAGVSVVPGASSLPVMTEPVPGESEGSAPPSTRRVVALLLAGLLWCSATALFGYTVYVDPFSGWGQTLPLVVLAVLGVALVPVLMRRPSTGPDLGALLLSGWISWFGASQLHGTPFPYGGMTADIARLSAAATKFSVHVGSTDLLVKGLPIEYPPLFPWIVGRTSAMTDLPAWRLMGIGSVVFCAVAVLVGYLLWSRLLAGSLALAVCALPAAVYGDPRKAHEVAALCVITPWVLTGLARLGRAATPLLSWWVTGLVGGLLLTVYQGYLVFSFVGLLVVVALGLVRRPRWPYLRHLLLATVTALLTASWFLVPWLWNLARLGGDGSADLFVPFEIARDPLHLPLRLPVTVAVVLTGGLLLLAWHARRRDWARVLLAIAVSAMAYRWVMLWRYRQTGHTAFLHYTDRLYDGVLAVGFVLGLVASWPSVMGWLEQRRTSAGLPWVTRPRSPIRPGTLSAASSVAVSTVVVVALGVFWEAHRAGHPEDRDTPNFTRLAHAAQLPSGGYPRYNAAAGQWQGLPAEQVRDVVERAYGRGAVPTVLSYDESISSYYPWYQYIGVGGNSANSLAHWPRREAAVRQLAAVQDPEAFAEAAAGMEAGPIDVFVLKGVDRWFMWRDIRFEKSQLASPYFRTTLTGGNTWVFTRVGAKVEHADYPR